MSASTALQLPCGLERVLDGAGVARCQVGDDHLVLGVPGRHAEGVGKLTYQPVAVVEVGPDDQVTAVDLAGDQPAVVAPLRQPVRRTAPHAGQCSGQPVYLADLQQLRSPMRAWRYVGVPAAATAIGSVSHRPLGGSSPLVMPRSRLASA